MLANEVSQRGVKMCVPNKPSMGLAFSLIHVLQ